MRAFLLLLLVTRVLSAPICSPIVQVIVNINGISPITDPTTSNQLPIPEAIISKEPTIMKPEHETSIAEQTDVELVTENLELINPQPEVGKPEVIDVGSVFPETAETESVSINVPPIQSELEIPDNVVYEEQTNEIESVDVIADETAEPMNLEASESVADELQVPSTSAETNEEADTVNAEITNDAEEPNELQHAIESNEEANNLQLKPISDSTVGIEEIDSNLNDVMGIAEDPVELYLGSDNEFGDILYNSVNENPLGDAIDTDNLDQFENTEFIEGVSIMGPFEGQVLPVIETNNGVDATSNQPIEMDQLLPQNDDVQGKPQHVMGMQHGFINKPIIEKP